MPLGIWDCDEGEKKGKENKAITAENNLIM